MKPNLPKDPPEELLRSMAFRYDHGLAIPGYYDQPFLKEKNLGATHEQMLESTLRTMSQLYEEVAGYGFYKYKREVPEEIISPSEPIYSFDGESEQ